MVNLIKADCIRFLKSNFFRNTVVSIPISIIIYCVYMKIGLNKGFINIPNVEIFEKDFATQLRVFPFCYGFFAIMSLIAPLCMILFIEREMDSGSIRNKIITGNKRSKVYCSWVVSCIVASIIIFLAITAACFGCGIILFKGNSIYTFKECLQNLVQGFFMICVLSSCYCVMITVPKMQPALTIFIFCIALVASILGGIKCDELYNNPEFSLDVVETSTGIREVEVKNPLYRTPEQADKAAWWLKMLPSSEAWLIAHDKVKYDIIPFQIAATVIYMVIGINLFKRKQIN